MTNKKLAMMALLSIAMLALVTNPVFAEKSATTSSHHPGKHPIVRPLVTQTFTFKDDCGVTQSGWYEPETYSAPDDQWYVAWSWPSSIDSCLGGNSFHDVTNTLTDVTAPWVETPGETSTHYSNLAGTTYTIYVSGSDTFYNAGDSMAANSVGCYSGGTECFHATTANWIA